MYRATILRMTARVLSSVLCIFCAACGGTSDEPAGEASSAGDAVSRTFLYMDFEDGDISGWRFEGYFSRSPLETRHLWSDGGPGSRGSMRCSVLEGDSSGAITFDLTANGYDPISVGPETRIAWSWKPSFEDKGNGCWFFAWCSNPGLDVLFPVRAVHWRRSTHDVVGAYYDPENFFSIHTEPLYSYLCMRSDPAICDEFSIEKIVIGISMTEGGEVEIDDIWIGEGEPPDSVFTRRSDPSASLDSYDKITGVSFGFLDHDWTPDRIETYHDRVEVCLDSPASEGGSRPAREPRAVRSHGGSRGSGEAGLHDVDGDGLQDIVLHYDDFRGNVLYRNILDRGRIGEVSGMYGEMVCGGQAFYGSAASDVNGDGRLDFFLVNPFQQKHRFGGSRYLESVPGGLADRTAESGVVRQGAFGAMFGDVDGDGDQDLFVGYRPYPLTDTSKAIPYLYINDGAVGLLPAAERIDLPPGLYVEGGVLADLDNDGDLDLYVAASEIGSGARGQILPSRNYLMINDGSGRFADETLQRGGSLVSSKTQAALAGDFDNDGDIDIFELRDGESCVMYLNRGDGHFRADSLWHSFIREAGITGGAVADINADGRLDAALVQRKAEEPDYIVNHPFPPGAEQGSFLQVRLKGLGPNSAGIGGKVFVWEQGHLGDPGFLLGYREIQSCRGFNSCSPPVAHFGLGDRISVDMRVVFPSRDGGEPVVREMRSVEAGRRVQVVETGNPLIAAMHSPAAMQTGWNLSLAFFSVPGWIYSLAAFAGVGAAGLYLRSKPERRQYGRRDVAVLAGAGAIALLAMARQWETAALFIALSAVVVWKRDTVESWFPRLFEGENAGRTKKDMALERISMATHTKSDFEFLGRWYDGGGEGLRDRSGIEEDFGRLASLVSEIRACMPRSRHWKLARAELHTLRRAVERMASGSAGADGSVPGHHRDDREEYARSLARLQSILDDARTSLQRDFSAPFLDCWREVAARFAPKLESAGIRLEERFQPGVEDVNVLITREEFDFVFSNLMVNSIWASGDSGGRIRAGVSFDDRRLRCVFEDDGAGMSPETIERLFVGKVPSKRPGGEGRGCMESGEIIRRRRGTIRAEDRSGRGAKVFVELYRVYGSRRPGDERRR